jgi:molecular chaperone GrpE
MDKIGKENQELPEFQVIDKRHFVDLDNVKIEEEKPSYPTFVEELMGKLAETERRFEEKKKQIDDEIARTKARIESELERRLAIEKQRLVAPLLEVLDNLERALDASAKGGSPDHLREGVNMTASLFRSKLQSLGVEPIQVLNQPFDPNLGQALGVVLVESESQDGVVIEEVLRGYKMDDQLLRPAQVRVGQLSAKKYEVRGTRNDV